VQKHNWWLRVQLPTSILPHPQQCFMFHRWVVSSPDPQLGRSVGKVVYWGFGNETNRWVDRNTSYFGNRPHWGRFLSCSRDFNKWCLDQNELPLFNHWLILHTVFMHTQTSQLTVQEMNVTQASVPAMGASMCATAPWVRAAMRSAPAIQCSWWIKYSHVLVS